MGLWVAFGLLLSAAYINGVLGLGYLTDPVRISYQLYRYCWKGILLFPLMVMFLRRSSDLRAIANVLIISTFVEAVAGILQARSGVNSRGLFELFSPNAFAASLLVPLFFSVSLAVQGKKRLWYQISFPVLLLALFYSGSRGAMLGFLGGFAVYGLLDVFLCKKTGTLKIVLGLCMLCGTVLLVRPEAGQKSGSMAGISEMSDPGEAHTFQWRLTERWPFFIQRSLDNPLLGVGTDVELSFGYGTNTPHNGYLSRAVISGIPSLMIWLCLIAVTLKKSLFVLKNADNEFLRITGLLVFSSMVV